ncbi:MAG: cytosolic protein, partial [Chloroflexi bacterium]|nr:cytosolic protein [Chloroflexota bacterium]
MSTADMLVRGSVDMHVHHGPDVHIPRCVDAAQAALQADKAGMRAIVLKSHDYPTTPLAQVVNRRVHQLTVFGSLTLDYSVGGLNPQAVETSALLGARVLWMPTFSSANDREKLGFRGEGIRIVDGEGQVLPVVRQILDIIKKHDMVLATGHVSAPEAFALVDEARRTGLTRIVVTHPLGQRTGATLGLDEQRRMADKGVFIEHCFGCTLPLGGRLEPVKIVEAVRAVGAEHCILSTDLGQDWNPPPAEGMRMMIGTL